MKYNMCSLLVWDLFHPMVFQLISFDLVLQNVGGVGEPPITEQIGPGDVAD